VFLENSKGKLRPFIFPNLRNEDFRSIHHACACRGATGAISPKEKLSGFAPQTEL